jgi:hypothetical protein
MQLAKHITNPRRPPRHPHVCAEGNLRDSCIRLPLRRIRHHRTVCRRTRWTQSRENRHKRCYRASTRGSRARSYLCHRTRRLPKYTDLGTHRSHSTSCGARLRNTPCLHLAGSNDRNRSLSSCGQMRRHPHPSMRHLSERLSLWVRQRAGRACPTRRSRMRERRERQCAVSFR